MVESSVLLCFWIGDQCDVIKGFKRNVMNIHVWNVKTFKNFKMADCFFPKTVCTQIFGSIIPRESGLDNNWVSCVVYVWPFGLLQPNMVAKDHKRPLSNSIKPDCVFPHIFLAKRNWTFIGLCWIYCPLFLGFADLLIIPTDRFLMCYNLIRKNQWLKRGTAKMCE